MESLDKNQTWKLVKQPKERKLSLVNGSSRKRRKRHHQRASSIKLKLLLYDILREKELIIMRFSHT